MLFLICLAREYYINMCNPYSVSWWCDQTPHPTSRGVVIAQKSSTRVYSQDLPQEVTLSAQIICFFICSKGPADMIYKYSSCRYEIQGQPGAANHSGFCLCANVALLMPQRGTYYKSEVTNYNSFYAVMKYLVFIYVTASKN